MKCILCNKEIFDYPVNTKVIEGITIHWDCWEDLEPPLKFKLNEPLEVRKQRKKERVERIKQRFKDIIKEKGIIDEG